MALVQNKLMTTPLQCMRLQCATRAHHLLTLLSNTTQTVAMPLSETTIVALTASVATEKCSVRNYEKLKEAISGLRVFHVRVRLCVEIFRRDYVHCRECRAW